MAFVPAESIFRTHGRVDTSFPPSSPQAFHGFSELLLGRSTTASLSSVDRSEELHPDDDMSDDGCQMLGEKKRRLTVDQVRALEKSFELGNKLEPERKMELARELGLHPRQVAIWFQNRRARWKTKKLERDYDVLKRQLEKIKADNDALKSQNKNLQTQLSALKTRESAGFLSGPINYLKKLENDDQQGSWSINGSCDDNGCEFNLNKSVPSLDTTLLYHPHQTNENDVVDAAAITFPIATQTHGYVFAANCEESQDLWPWPEH